MLSSLFRRREARASIEDPTTPLNYDAAWAHAWGGVDPQGAGIAVNALTVQASSAASACIRVLAESVAKMEFRLVKLDRQKNVYEPVLEHPTLRLVEIAPNARQTALEWKQTGMLHCAVYGNAYGRVHRVGRTGSPESIDWLSAKSVKVKLSPDGREKVFEVLRGPEQPPEIVPDDGSMLHIPWLDTWGRGDVGQSPLQTNAAKHIALDIALVQQGLDFFGNAMQAEFVLRHPGEVPTPVRERLLQQMRASSGPGKAFKGLLLEDGIEHISTSTDPDKAQMLETVRQSIENVCRLFGVPAHKINHPLAAQGYNSLEAAEQQFELETKSTWGWRWAQRMSRTLLTTAEIQGGMRYEPVLNEAQRVSFEAQAKGLGSMHQMGLITANEGRRRLGMNPDPDGDKLIAQKALVPLEDIVSGKTQVAPPSPFGGEGGDEEEPFGAPGDENEEKALVLGDPEARAARNRETEIRAEVLQRQRGDLQTNYREVLEHVIARYVRIEVERLQKIFERSLKETDPVDYFRKEARRVWRDVLPDVIRRELGPMLGALSAQVFSMIQGEVGMIIDGAAERAARAAEAELDAAVTKHTISSEKQLIPLAEGAGGEFDVEAFEQVRARLEEWGEKRAHKVARTEATRASNAFALAAYAMVGVMTTTWQTRGSETCPICNAMSGRSAVLNQPFAEAGEVINEEGTSPLKIGRGGLRQPPIHTGCDCILVGGF